MNYGRFKYFQPNEMDLKDKVGDCQIRALAKALGKTWHETFDIITPICRENMTMDIFCCDLDKTKKAMETLGFIYHGVSNKKGSKRPTIDSFAKAHPKGTFVVTVSHHVVAVVDGIYYDTWDSGWKSMYGYYEKA